MKNLIKQWIEGISRTEITLDKVRDLENRNIKYGEELSKLQQANTDLRQEMERQWDYIRATVEYLNVDIRHKREDMPSWSLIPRRIVTFFPKIRSVENNDNPQV